MVTLKRIYPRNYVSPWNTFNLLLLAEGFIASQENAFVIACNDLIKNLLSTTPFNVTRYKPAWINIYRHFIPSNVAGPTIDAPARDTVFLSTYNSSTQELTIDSARVANVIDNVSIAGEDGEYGISGFNIWKRIQERYGPTGAAVVVLLPSSVDGISVSGEMEYPGRFPPIVTPNVNFAATTIDDRWYQIVIRVIARVLNLGDEFELSGANYREPDTYEVLRLNKYPNIVYLEEPFPGPPPHSFKWYEMLTEKQRSKELTVVPHQSPDIPDYTIYKSHIINSDIQLIEGGGGYRKKIYRSSKDCLMRRQIGGTFRDKLPLKKATIPLCTVCRSYISQILTDQITTFKETRRKISNQILLFCCGKGKQIEPQNPDPLYPSFYQRYSWRLFFPFVLHEVAYLPRLFDLPGPKLLP